MKYLLLVFYDEKVRSGLSEPESQALIREAIEYDNGLRNNGHLIARNARRFLRKARKIRRSNRIVSKSSYAGSAGTGPASSRTTTGGPGKRLKVARNRSAEGDAIDLLLC